MTRASLLTKLLSSCLIATLTACASTSAQQNPSASTAPGSWPDGADPSFDNLDASTEAGPQSSSSAAADSSAGFGASSTQDTAATNPTGAETASEGPSAEVLAAIRRAQFGSASRTYRGHVRAWHTPPSSPPARTPEGRPHLVLEVINTQERIELAPLRDDGGFSAFDLQVASYALRDQRANQTFPIDPRALDVAYRIQLHFAAKAVRILSAYRVAKKHASNHSRGRALDLIIPGTRDAEVASFARTIGFVGVGVYPSGGFIHVDTRPRSYFWVDYSAPGQRSRNRPVYPRLAAQADEKARARGESPPAPEPTPVEDVESAADNETYNTSTAPTRAGE